MVYNYSHFPKSPCTASNLPTQVLPAPISHCAQAQVLPAPISHCAQAYVNPLTPCAGNFCSNHFNSYHNCYDACNSLCDGFGFLY